MIRNDPQTYIIKFHDAQPPEIHVTAPGTLDRDGNVYLDVAVQDALLAFIDSLSDLPCVVVWEHAQPDWREARVM